ncbi:ComF family protein [Leptospira fletcheri]|uniref:ComF family protein n=1 Tax=Leptospira fletcheri TaxID=2484981 RepID=A0A4R9GBR6_9LEPT|nr:ComF family protein [Leptospira fletcheri]TGK08580.1 ComF family protein [Leptospira fletcheri]
MIDKILYKSLNYFFPILCGMCGKEDFRSVRSGLCRICAKETPRIWKKKGCPICSGKTTEDVCDYCTSRNVFFTEARYLRERTDLLAEVLNKIKSRHEYPLSLFLSIGAKTALRSWGNRGIDACFLLPNSSSGRFGSFPLRPFSPMRELLSRAEKTLGLPRIDPLLKRSNSRQAGKSYADRFFHARSAWEIRPSWQGCCPSKVLLLDDVFTTGASVNEASRILLENGTEEVYILTYLRTME